MTVEAAFDIFHNFSHHSLVSNVHNTNKVVINICVQVFVRIYGFFSLGKMPGSGMVGSYDKYMLNFLRNCQTVCQSGYTISHSHQQCRSAPVSPHPYQDLVWSVF